MGVHVVPVRFETDDRFELSGAWFESPAPERVIVLHGATAVPARYYRRFAEWLTTERNAHVLIYDYRDIGLSAQRSARRSTADMAAWGVLDSAAALDFALDTYPDLPVWTVGHSLGGMCLGFHPNAGRIERHIAIASGPAHWIQHPWTAMPKIVAFWFLVGPACVTTLGYFPGRLFGSKVDLPAAAYWQWRRWCMNAEFHRVDWGRALPEPTPERVRCPVELVAFADDDLIPPHQVKKLGRFYPHAETIFRCIEPEDVGLQRIGHIAGFSARCEPAWAHMVRDVRLQ
ncbi:MAG: alpha/beta fold hydrolase [Myxococcota bacterium]